MTKKQTKALQELESFLEPSIFGEKEFEKSFARLGVVSLIVHYKDSKNPFFIWDIISICSKHDLPFPRMVKDYLAINAENIIEHANIAEETLFDNKLRNGDISQKEHSECIKHIRKRRANIPNQILSSFGFSAGIGQDVIENYNVIKNRLSIFMMVEECLESGTKKSHAVEEVANKLGIGKTTVGDAYRYFQEKHNILNTPLISANWYNLPIKDI